MISFGSELRDYDFSSRREFILTAADSYCSSSLAGNTRKYHGLLVHRGQIYFSSLDEIVNGRRISVASYLGALCADGLRYLDAFSFPPPRFQYELGELVLIKTIQFDGTLRITYQAWGDALIKLVPLITQRSIHALRTSFDFSPIQIPQGVLVGKLRLSSNAEFKLNPDIYWNVFYPRDHQRGYDCVEHLYAPGYFIAKLQDSWLELRAELEGVGSRAKLSRMLPRTPIQWLKLAARSFLVGDAIYAGYHWFAEPWGRDALVSLPGLLLVTGKFQHAQRIFNFFAKHLRRGLIPNRIPDDYNSSDASLWFCYALGKYLQATNDLKFLHRMKPWLEQIITEYPDTQITQLDSGLIQVERCTSWMDTKFTPRQGKPVEINALWINALKLAHFLEIDCTDLLKQAQHGFSRFWNPSKGYLYDVLDPDDSSFRPNQLIPIALGLVQPSQAVSILKLIRSKLLTPYGLRTLSPDDPRYKGHYTGDESYHNGCAWPWLLGFYIESWLRYFGPQSRDYCASLLVPLLEHLKDAGLGTISECFDGDPPYEPNGCISQAWSVAELLRACKLIQG